MLRGNFREQNAYMRKEKQYPINNLSFYQKNLEKEQNMPKIGREKETIRIREDSVKLKTNNYTENHWKQKLFL